MMPDIGEGMVLNTDYQKLAGTASTSTLEQSVAYLRNAYQDAGRVVAEAEKRLADAQERARVADREFQLVRDAYFVVSPESDDRPQTQAYEGDVSYTNGRY